MIYFCAKKLKRIVLKIVRIMSHSLPVFKSCQASQMTVDFPSADRFKVKLCYYDEQGYRYYKDYYNNQPVERQISQCAKRWTVCGGSYTKLLKFSISTEEIACTMEKEFLSKPSFDLLVIKSHLLGNGITGDIMIPLLSQTLKCYNISFNYL